MSRLTESTGLLSALLDGTGRACLLCDESGDVLEFSEAAGRLFEFSEEHGPRSMSVLTQRFADWLARADESVALTWNERALTLRFQPVEFVGRPLFVVHVHEALNGEPSSVFPRGFLETVDDGTDGQTAIGFVVVDEVGRVVEANPEYARLLGYREPAELLGRLIAEWTSECDKERLKAAIRQCSEYGSPQVLDVGQIRYRGDVISVEILAKVVPVGDDEAHVAMLCADVSDRKMAESAVLRAREELESRVTVRTAELEASNRRLREEIQQREDAERALAASEERFRLAAEGTNDGLWDWDVVEGTCWYSTRFMELLGYQTDELALEIGSWEERLHPDDHPVVFAAVDEHFRTRNQYEVVYRLRTRTGDYRWFGARGRAVWDRDGRVVRMVGSTTDVHEKWLAEQALAKSEERFRASFENSSDAILLADTETGRIVEANDAAARLFGATVGQLTTMHQAELHPPEDSERYRRLFEKHIRTGHTMPNLQVQRLDGTRVPVDITAAVFEVDGRRVIQGVFRDVSERQSAEEATRRLVAIVEGSHEAIHSAGLDRTIQSWNRAAERVFGFTSDEVIGKVRFDEVLVPPERQDEANRFVKRLMNGETIVRFETQRLHRNGSRIDVTLTLSPLRNELGDVVGISAITHDISERKRAEAERAEALARFESIARNVPDCFWRANVDRDGEFAMEYVSPGWTRIWGRAPDEVYRDYRTWLGSVVPEDLPTAEAMLARTVETCESQTAEFRIRTKAGDVRWVEDRITPLVADNRVTGVEGVARDITARKEAEAARQVVQRRLQAVVTSAPIVLTVIDLDGTITMFEGSGLEAVGLDPGHFVGANYYEVWAKSRPLVDSVRDAIRGKSRPAVTHCVGNVVFETRCSPVRDENGEVTGAISICTNVTEREVAQRELRTIADNIPACIAYIDATQRFRFVNRGAANFQGHVNPEDLIGRRLDEVCRPDCYERLRPYAQSALAGETVEFEDVFDFDRMGTRRMRASLVPDVDSGDVRGFYLFMVDVTEQRLAEEAVRKHVDELAHVSRLATIGEMATSLAHELNQPLASATMFAESCATRARTTPGDATQLLPTLDRLVEQVLRAGEIVRRIRRYVSKESFVPSSCQIEELVGNVLSLMATDLAEERISVEVDTSRSRLQVDADRVQIEQVLLNLFKNAREAISEAGCESRRINCRCTDSDDDEFVEISVSDTGPGIQHTELERVFDAFFSTKPRGMGMGLPICRTIIESHGGHLTVSSVEDEGTTFRFVLPAAIPVGENDDEV